MVKLAGELDIASAEIAEQAMAEEFELLDLSELEFIDSVGIRVLIRSRARRPEPLPVRGVRPMIHRVLDLAGVVGEFVFIDAVSETPPH